jgi:hypothetical protein
MTILYIHRLLFIHFYLFLAGPIGISESLVMIIYHANNETKSNISFCTCIIKALGVESAFCVEQALSIGISKSLVLDEYCADYVTKSNTFLFVRAHIITKPSVSSKPSVSAKPSNEPTVSSQPSLSNKPSVSASVSHLSLMNTASIIIITRRM